MSGVNKAIILGRLGQDPEIRYMNDGKAVANLSLATSETWKDKTTNEKKEKTEWHRVVFFGRTAEVCGEYLSKGSEVYVEGRLQTRKWQDNAGTDRYTTEIIGDKMTMVGGKSQDKPKHPSQQPSQQPQIPEPDEFGDDIPF